MARLFEKPIFLVLVISFAGCTAFASKQEYWLYRNLMEEKDMQKKAELYREYVSEYPSGVYADKMKDVEQEIEFAVYNATGQDKDRILKYLELFPEGRFVSDAKDKLVQLDALKKMQEAEALALKKQKEEQAAVAEAKRKKYSGEITSAMADWIGISSSTFVYGISVTELAKASKKFKELWSSEPLAECGTDKCLKSYDLSYHFQVLGATRVDRIIRMVIMVKFKEGKIWGMSINFPGRGFIGLRELLENEPKDTTIAELEDAGAFTTELLSATLESLLPAGKEAEKEGYMYYYESEGANFYLVRTDIGQGGVVDTLAIQLLPAPPPGVVKGKKKKKKKKTVEPPPPIIPVEELIFKPAAPEAAPPPAAPLPVPEKAAPAPPTPPPPPAASPAVPPAPPPAKAAEPAKPGGAAEPPPPPPSKPEKATKKPPKGKKGKKGPPPKKGKKALPDNP